MDYRTNGLNNLIQKIVYQIRHLIMWLSVCHRFILKDNRKKQFFIGFLFILLNPILLHQGDNGLYSPYFYRIGLLIGGTIEDMQSTAHNCAAKKGLSISSIVPTGHTFSHVPQLIHFSLE